VLEKPTSETTYDYEVNSVLAGYLEKIFQVLVASYPKETFKSLYTEERG